ncbi:MAG: hypothetical protein PUJ69_00290 [Porphyromonas somerae]|uniref:hypothetical protein n=1 Tax=Porphyromonas TaxID=836 RepID=UPI001B8D8338|nr:MULTISPECIES: hypothetical protein [Porphyromonas]MBR8730605.1 hypothetical protein [Porphyromonas levii]MDD7557102.1 hypothetical protein [Porphyromonas somerae]MDY3884082.1 hypothetical protein [Porphyromonas somerae]MDY5815782.1 hypothetical protein [Porphyromonas somerae]
MRSRVNQIQCFMHSNRGCYITITIEQIENPDEHYNSISLEEIKFPTIQRYFLRGNNVTFSKGENCVFENRKTNSDISLLEIIFPMMQRYFLRGNNAIGFRNNVSLTETVC